MYRTPLCFTAVLVGCTSVSDGGSQEDAALAGPAIDPTHACPVASFGAEGSYELTADVVYDVEDGEELLLDLYVPDASGLRPGVVMVHGGGFTSGDRGYMTRAAEYYASSGFVVLNVTYRKVPAVGLGDLVRDVACSVRWGIAHADELGMDTQCVGTVGESAGAYLASMATLASTDPAFSFGCDTGAELDGLTRWSLPYYGVSDLTEFEAAGGLGVLMPGLVDRAGLSAEVLSPTTYAGRDPSVGFFLPHGTEDNVVPSSQSEVFFDALAPAGHPVELRIMEGVPHGFMTGDGFLGGASRSIQVDIESFVLEMNAAR